MTKRCCRNCANYLHGGSRRTSGYVCACGKRTPAAHLETTCKDFVVKRLLSDEGSRK